MNAAFGLPTSIGEALKRILHGRFFPKSDPSITGLLSVLPFASAAASRDRPKRARTRQQRANSELAGDCSIFACPERP
jgi:hypothetical protein